MQMNTSNGWLGGHLEEDLKEALRRLIPKGEKSYLLDGKIAPRNAKFDVIKCEIINDAT